MNRLMSIGVILILAVPNGRAQDSNALTTDRAPSPATQQPSPYRPAKPQPVEAKRITVFPTGDAQESVVAMKLIAYLEKEGFATGKVTELSLTPDAPLRVDFIMRHDESHEKVKEFLTSLGDAGVERIFFETDENVYGGEEKNGLSFRAIPGYSPVEVERIENAAVSAAKSCGLALSLGGTYVKSWKPNGESATVSSLRPVALKRIAVFADVDEEPSEMVTRFLTDLESDGIANVEAKASAPAFRYPIQLNFVPKEDEPLEKIKQFIVALRQSGVEQINCNLRGHRAGSNLVLFTVLPGYSHEEQQRIENAARTAAANCGLSIGLAGTMVFSSDANAQKITQLRTDYEAANQQAHDLAESLRQTPDAPKKSELRTAVQRAFKLRQSLLRAELQEMQARLEKTQQSLDMRDRMADQIVDRRVEDLLNPQLKWDDDKGPIDTPEATPSAANGPSKPTTTRSSITELEGDWHLVFSTDNEGNHFAPSPTNLTFKRDQYTLAYQGRRIDRRVEIYPDSKEIRYFKDKSGFVQNHYVLEGDRLTIYDETGRNEYVRGHVALPKTIPKATEEQKSRWRSGIVEILGQPAADKSREPRLVGYGVIVSPQTRMIAQVGALEGYSFFARFDDGGVVPIRILEEGSQSWLTFEPEQALEANHHFRFSEATVGKGDEVHFWGRAATVSEGPTLELFETPVRKLDRKAPARRQTVWELSRHDKLDGSLPVLDSNGDLLAITLAGTNVGTNDLLLAIPVAELKTMFPMSIGSLTGIENPVEPAAIR